MLYYNTDIVVVNDGRCKKRILFIFLAKEKPLRNEQLSAQEAARSQVE